MAFKTSKQVDFTYTSPQEMYQDNKNKKIMGLLDYQAAMLQKYIENYDKNVLVREKPKKMITYEEIIELRKKLDEDKISTDELKNMYFTDENMSKKSWQTKD
jgi:hypothetical protein